MATIGPYVLQIYGSIGDVNPVDHDGGNVYQHAQSDSVHVDYIMAPCDDESWECTECDGSGYAPAYCRDGACSYHETVYQDGPNGEPSDVPATCDGNGEASCVTCKGTGENPALRWTLYTAVINGDEADVGTWIDWSNVASCCGAPTECRRNDKVPAHYVDAFASKDPMRMAHAIWDAASYHGWDNFDSYPRLLSRDDAEKHFP